MVLDMREVVTMFWGDDGLLKVILKSNPTILSFLATKDNNLMTLYRDWALKQES